ncbi:UDP-N-acetylglucosamine 2-epimerase (non-hydrolyzing) [Comamonas testosteroni]|uniref:UDP-N-acetylglucosamine 2-epimerase (non-hydrolyzing) n=1 Tax=Comamonas testosteroni TaxID=285 RepID=A0A373F9A6_COMTE|nr:UDP-N-acetylglucosamine 2-epimerase (non-hydrolyzing) [Comamonas testosteroni]RGE40763.1 UDP-N-acetylglucosamine 2-epimerase (non-hydrolyzing) [Comamonas testosteroni]
MKILSVIGTRPEAIKMAPVVRQLAAAPGVESVVCVSGQHRSMLEQVLQLFDIAPDHDLAVMTQGQSLNGLSARILQGMDELLGKVQPDQVLVHGDTTTAMAAAMAAFHRHIPVVHVEAGLRTGSMSEPWPEEMNRRVIDVMAEVLLAPTEKAKANLLAENLQGQIHVVGNTVIDALKWVAQRFEKDSALRESVDARLPKIAEGKRMVLLTSHRRENHGDGLAHICDAVTELVAAGDVEVIYPVHLNPLVKDVVQERLGHVAGVHLIAPQDYLGFVRLMQRAYFVMTDSGGVQEEAPALGKPVLLLRDVTERPSVVEAGVVKLVGTDKQRIVSAANELLHDSAAYARMTHAAHPYGHGDASEQIVKIVLNAKVA